MKYLFLLLLLSGVVSAQCIEPESGMVIDSNTEFCRGEYDISKEMVVVADDVSISCDNTTIQTGHPITGIRVKEVSGVQIRECYFKGFVNALYFDQSFNNVAIGNIFLQNNNAIVQEDSINNVISDNVFLENQRDIYSVTVPEAKEEVVVEDVAAEEAVVDEEVIAAEEARLEFILDENTTRIYNEMREMFSSYVAATENSVTVKREFMYDPDKDMTTVAITIIPNWTVGNYSYYEKIPKCLAWHVREVLFSDTGYRVIADDPVLMWNFASIDTKRKISYSVNKKVDDECRKLLEGFGFATYVPEKKRGFMVYLYAFLGIAATVLLIRIVIAIKDMGE